MITIIAGVLGFTSIILLLVLLLLLTERWVVGNTRINLTLTNNRQHPLQVTTGNTLLNTLNEQHIYLASACGGKGTCGACELRVLSGGGAVLPTERALLPYARIRKGHRLACQVKVKRDLTVQLPADWRQSTKWQCRVHSNHNVATFIKELILRFNPGEEMPFRAGDYIQIECPSYQLDYHDIDIAPRFQARWQQAGMSQYQAGNANNTSRSYSLATYPGERQELVLNIRIAPPPPEQPQAPPGIVSSYLFHLKPGDPLIISGPFGELHPDPGNEEMVFIGGGAGMAPMRSLILDQLLRHHTRRKISFWYGARSLCEAFYQDDFNALQQTHDNFDWTLALSSAQPEDKWQGASGFIHQVVYEHYLCHHPAPEDIQYYLCGPPPMIDACVRMLDELGVEAGNIYFDKFG